MEKIIKRLIVSITLLLSINANAQYTFTISLTISGNCGGLEGAVARRAIESWYNYVNQQISMQKMSKQECLTIRAQVVETASGYSYGDCHARFTISPCTGTDNEDDIQTASDIILGPTQGTSFYSSSYANEINDWYDDEQERRSRLDKAYSPNSLNYVETADKKYDASRVTMRRRGWVLDTDKEFRSLNVDASGGNTGHSDDFLPLKEYPSEEKVVSQYVARINGVVPPTFDNSEDYLAWIKIQFEEMSGYNVDELIVAFNPSDDERKALANYRDVVREILDELWDGYYAAETSAEKKSVDMAILAFECYGDNSMYMGQTNYAKVHMDDLLEDDPMRNVLAAIERANSTDIITGFHAELFFNDVTKEYTIGFAGSGAELADWINNGMQASGHEFPQQQLTNAIIKALNDLPEETNVNIVGHSLGGALASYVGLATGKPTYTYNAEGVSDVILAANGLHEKKQSGDYQITAYYNPIDILSVTQDAVPSDVIAASAIGTRVPLPEMLPQKEDITTTDMLNAHKMGPIVETMMSRHNETQSLWAERHEKVKALIKENSQVGMRTVGFVNIPIND